MKKLLEKYREIILYLIFGVLTTFVGWAVYFAILFVGKAAFGIPPETTTGGAYLAIYTAAQIIQWVAAVLFAFFTNRKWVFTGADREAKMLPQLTSNQPFRCATTVWLTVATLLYAAYNIKAEVRTMRYCMRKSRGKIL